MTHQTDITTQSCGHHLHHLNQDSTFDFFQFLAHYRLINGPIFLNIELVRDIVPMNVLIKFEKNPKQIVDCIAFTTLMEIRTQNRLFLAHYGPITGPIFSDIELVRDIVPMNVPIKFEKNP